MILRKNIIIKEIKIFLKLYYINFLFFFDQSEKNQILKLSMIKNIFNKNLF